MKRILYIILGSIFLGLGILGIVLPILPTTPFLLLTLTCYAKGSKKFETWFKNTTLYHRYLEDFITHRAMKKREKWMLLIFVDVVLFITIIMVKNLWVTLALIFIDVLKYLYFMTKVKTLPNDFKTKEHMQPQKNTFV